MATAPSAEISPRAPAWLAGAVLVVAVALAYANSLHGPFVFDDVESITNNPSIRQLASAAIWSPPPGLTVSGRPLLNASLALNYAAGGNEVRGYHVANVCIHALAALVLFGLLRRTFALPRLRARFASGGKGIAFGGALMWALHPLHTESVTYVVQRAESLMGLFYLLTLWCFVRGVGAPRPRRWQIAGVLACALGMATKEVMVTAPLVVLLCDRVLVAGSFRECWRTRRGLHVTLAATWLVLGWCVLRGDRAGTAGFASGVAPGDYALTQCRAVVHYLRLAAWPHPLVFDYGPYEAVSISELLPFAVMLVVILAATIWLLRRRPAAGFAAIAFLLLLAPTSSFVPIATEPMAEHRMYLPLAALAGLAAAGLARLGRPRGFAVVATVALGFGGWTYARNEVYRTERTLWSDTVDAAPKNPRAHSSLAWALLADGDATAAEKHFTTALALRSDYADARRGRARIMEEGGRPREAEDEYRAILRIRPGDFVAHHALGTLAFQRGDLAAAAAHFTDALKIDPDSAPAHNNLGCVLYEQGDFSGARTHEEIALRLKPDYAESHFNLGNALVRLNLLHEARDSYQRALALTPDYAEAHAHLGVALQNLGETDAAIRHYREALRLRPDFEFVRKNLEPLLASPRR